jgi:hypothetical protein
MKLSCGHTRHSLQMPVRMGLVPNRRYFVDQPNSALALAAWRRRLRRESSKRAAFWQREFPVGETLRLAAALCSPVGVTAIHRAAQLRNSLLVPVAHGPTVIREDYSGEAPRRCSKISDVWVPATSASALRFSTTKDRRSSVSRAATCRMKSSAPARK